MFSPLHPVHCMPSFLSPHQSLPGLVLFNAEARSNQSETENLLQLKVPPLHLPSIDSSTYGTIRKIEKQERVAQLKILARRDRINEGIKKKRNKVSDRQLLLMNVRAGDWLLPTNVRTSNCIN